MHDRLIRALSTIEPFTGLDRSSLDEVARSCRFERYEAKRQRLGLEPEWGREGERKVRLVQEHAVYAAMVHAMDEAVGVVLAAGKHGMPVAIGFTTEPDGRLPSGQPLGDAIEAVDAATGGSAAYFMVNCAHPDHFSGVIGDEEWTRRIRGLRCNASRLSHAELDECEVLDEGDPVELGQQYAEFKERMPWLNVFGGCCGTDLRHVTEIADAVTK